jgi:hypothetical protein
VTSDEPTPDLERALAATTELREAILATRASEEWYSDEAQIVDLVQHSIARWAHDLGRTFRELAEALGRAAASPDRDEAPDHDPVGDLEFALIKVVSGRDALRAIASQVFGADRLRLDKPGVRFDPIESSLRQCLSELGAEGFRHAGKLKTMLEEIAEHPAVALRNGVVHALAPFPELTEVCWIRKTYLDERGGIVHWERGPLYPEGSLELGDAKPWTLYRWAYGSAEDAFMRLIVLAETLTALIRETDVLQPPASVFIWPDGRVQLERPVSNWLLSGLDPPDETDASVEQTDSPTDD